MSGNLIAFPGNGLPINNEDFRDAISEPSVRVDAQRIILDISGLTEYPVSSPVPIFMLKGELEGGTVHRITKSAKEFAIGTSADFPRWLCETGLRRDAALRLASYYVNGFELVSGAIAAKPHKNLPSFAGNLDEAVWQPEYGNQRLVLPYRVAARVALRSVEIEPITLPKKPYPPHIASLSNPLEIAQVRQLYSVLK